MFSRGFDLALPVLVTTTNVFLTQVLRPTNQAGTAKAIKFVLKRIGATDAQADAWAPHVWEAIQEVSPFFIDAENNAFIVAARANANISSEEVRRLTRHAFSMYAVALNVLPERKPFKPARVMMPMFAGMLLHLRDYGAYVPQHT
jgi:hypothetical protein